MPTNDTPKAPKPTPRPAIVFFDIDDTLFIKDSNSIPKTLIPALSSLKAAGTMIAIATGRSIGVIPPIIKTLIEQVGIELILSINGQYNQYQGNKFLDFPLSPTDIHHTITELTTKGITHACMTKDTIYTFGDDDNLRTALSSLHIGYVPSKHDSFDWQQPIYQILGFFGDKDTPPTLPAHLKTVRWHDVAVDILAQSASKARAIAAVLNHLGIDASQAAAFGDGLNDQEMIQLVGTGIAMGNAHPTLKAMADFVCLRHDEDGIAHALSDFGWI